MPGDCGRRRLIAGAALGTLGALGGLAPLRHARAALPDVVAAVRASVLPIGTFDPLASPRFAFHGTSFVVGDGRQVITNFHVLRAAKTGKPPRWAVRTPEGDMRDAAVVASDEEHDLVLLRIGGAALPALKLAPDDLVREGQPVALIGFPIGGLLGFQPVTHRGIVSSVASIALPAPNAARLGPQTLAQLRRGGFDIYQLDATAFPGNSGGPVFDAVTGDVVAVINMVLVQGSREEALKHPSGISYAIPVRWVRELLAQPAR